MESETFFSYREPGIVAQRRFVSLQRSFFLHFEKDIQVSLNWGLAALQYK